jgi:hypothetical protein
LDARWTDDKVEALAAESIRSGAAERTEDGAEALAELGVIMPSQCLFGDVARGP